MMTVIIDQQKSRAVVFDFKTPARVLELGQRSGDFFKRNAEFSCKPDDTEGIANIVFARNVQDCFAKVFLAAINTKYRRKVAQVDVSGAIVGVLGHAVGDPTPRRSTYPGGVRVVGTV